MLKAGGLPTNLESERVSRDAIGKMSEEAAQQWTAKFNPRAITAADFKTLYEAAFGPCATGVC